MCGIFTFIFGSGTKISVKRNKEIIEAFARTKHRGPDNSIIKNIDNGIIPVIMGFHRLCIMDKTDNGNQPMNLQQYPNLTLICNGEIYNYKQLAAENNFSLEWVDNFNYFDDSRWQKATHSWYSNNAQFIQGNAVFRYGNLILCLTSNTTSGYNPTPLGTNLEHDKFIQTKESPIYPNPFNSNLLISLSNQEQKELTGINIFDLSGKIIFNKKYAKNTDSYIKIDFSNSSLSSGVYFVEIIFTSKKQFLKTTYLR